MTQSSERSCALHDVIYQKPTDNTSVDEEFRLSCLLLVYIAVSLPALAMDPNSFYSREHGGTHVFIHSFEARINFLLIIISTQTLLNQLLTTSCSNYLQIDDNVVKKKYLHPRN